MHWSLVVCSMILAIHPYLYAAREDVYIKMYSLTIISLEVCLTNDIVGSEICRYDSTAFACLEIWKFFHRAQTHTGHCRNRIHGIRVVLGRTLNTGFPFLDMRRLWANLYAKLSRAVTHVQKAWTTIKNYIITSSRAKFVCKSVRTRYHVHG